MRKKLGSVWQISKFIAHGIVVCTCTVCFCPFVDLGVSASLNFSKVGSGDNTVELERAPQQQWLSLILSLECTTYFRVNDTFAFFFLLMKAQVESGAA